MKEFLKHWDDVLAYWVKNGEIPPEESHWMAANDKLCSELMPEPYLGNPYNCSVVIMNYNPGADDYDIKGKDSDDYRNDPAHHSSLDKPESMCYHYARNYRDRVAAGGYLGRCVDPMYDKSGLTQSGKCWWCKRLNWIKELEPRSDKLPFAIELCGWHSHTWPSVKYTPELLTKLKELLAPAIEEAIRNSDLGIGLCVGAQWRRSVLPAFGYQDVTGEVMGLNDYESDWKPLGDKRCYCILRNENDTYIISTWKQGFNNMDVPKQKFRKIELEIIERINEVRGKRKR